MKMCSKINILFTLFESNPDLEEDFLKFPSEGAQHANCSSKQMACPGNQSFNCYQIQPKHRVAKRLKTNGLTSIS